MTRIPAGGKRQWVILSLLLPLAALLCWYRLISARSGATAASLTRGPYLQSVTTNSVIVVWETNDAGDSRVDYGPTAGYGYTVSDTASVVHHALTLTNLSPYTTVHYRVSTGGQLLGDDGLFRTAAPLGQTFSFAVFGDTRTGHTRHQEVADAILAAAPDFVIHTGDFVEDGRVSSQWTTFFSVEQDLLQQSPIFGALGNHEHDSSKYFDAFHLPGNERWYSFDYGNVHFTALELDGGPIGPAQLTWLENDLAAAAQQWKVVFFHVPPYSSGCHGSDPVVRESLEPLFTRYGVDLVFNGHDHDYERSVADGVVYIVAGGGGAPLCGKEHANPASTYFAKVYHFVQVDVGGLCLDVAAVKRDGTRFDPFLLCDPSLFPSHFYLPVVTRAATNP